MKMSEKVFRMSRMVEADAGSGKTLAAVDDLIREYDDYWVFFDGLVEYFVMKVYDETNPENLEGKGPNHERIAIFKELQEMMQKAKKLAMTIKE